MNNIRLIGVVGLPGSGKSTFFNGMEYAGFIKKDDIGDSGKHGKDWQGNEEEIHSGIKNGPSAIASDIEFCNPYMRNAFEEHIGWRVEWVYFENAPWKCALNCLYRYYSGQNRPLHTEIRKIKRLSLIHQPSQLILPVINQEIATSSWECAVSCLHRFYCLDDGDEAHEVYGSLKPDLERIKKLAEAGGLVALNAH